MNAWEKFKKNRNLNNGSKLFKRFFQHKLIQHLDFFSNRCLIKFDFWYCIKIISVVVLSIWNRSLTFFWLVIAKFLQIHCLITNKNLIMLAHKISRISSIVANRTFFTYSNQISQPLQRSPPYVEAKEAVSCIKSGKKS